LYSAGENLQFSPLNQGMVTTEINERTKVGKVRLETARIMAEKNDLDGF
jgi:hypothetical protein